jgi:hypothetical protein
MNEPADVNMNLFFFSLRPSHSSSLFINLLGKMDDDVQGEGLPKNLQICCRLKIGPDRSVEK